LIIYPTPLSSFDQVAMNSNLAMVFNIKQSGYAGQVLLDGDSITYGYGGSLNQSWTKTLAAQFPSYRSYSFGVPGINMATLLTVESVRIVPRFNAGLTKNILVIWAGTNDIVAGTVATSVYANLQSYTSAAKTAGFKVVWVTMLPRTDLTVGEQTQWTAYNTAIRAATLGQSNTADALADVQSDPTIGPFSAASNHTYYCNVGPNDFSIGVHPTDIGNAIVAPYIIAAVGSL
jgi:lysophospholipase L1-like esterase